MSEQVLEVDQKWYAKMPGNPFLRNLLVTEVTEHTVCVTEVQINKLQQAPPLRFKKGDIDFVEFMVEEPSVIA